MSLRKTLFCSLFLFILLPLIGVNNQAGTTGFNALKLVFSARAMAMSNAFTGVTGNIEGMIFNPAAIMKIENTRVSSTYVNHVVETNGGAVQAVIPFIDFTNLGIMLNYMNYGLMNRTEVDSDNNLIETGETFGASDLVMGLSISRLINPQIDIGATVKTVLSSIDNHTASAVVIDAGLIHHPLNEKVKVGIAVRNLGIQTDYYTDNKYDEKLPITFAGGISYQLSQKTFTCLDVSKALGQDVGIRIGLENQIHPMLCLRAGYNTHANEWKTGGDWDWTAGISTGIGMKWKKYQLDYSLSSWGDLGFINQITVSYGF